MKSNRAFRYDDETAGPPGPNLGHYLNVDGLADGTATSATFVLTQEGEPDRDGDIVSVAGLRWDNWVRAGCPWFFGHQNPPAPIGSSVNPSTGQPDLFIERRRAVATCWFDREDPFAAFIARKVEKKLIKAVSLAFVPLESSRLENGTFYSAADVTEVSIVGVGSNPAALLDGASKSLARAISKCLRSGPKTDAALFREAYGNLRTVAAAVTGIRMPPVFKALGGTSGPTGGYTVPSAVAEKYISHDGAQWTVHAEDGRVLGRHDTREEALAQLRAVEAAKRGRSKASTQADIESYGQFPGHRTGQGEPNAVNCPCRGCREVGKCPCSKSCMCLTAAKQLTSLIRVAHAHRVSLSKILKQLKADGSPDLRRLLEHSLWVNDEITGWVEELDQLWATDPDRASIMARYLPDTSDPEFRSILGKYRAGRR
jgi:hypothetical protein